MAQTTVRCTVENCYFWGQGNLCDASGILVTGPMAGTNLHHAAPEQLSEMVDMVGDTPAAKSDETCCKTFRQRS